MSQPEAGSDVVGLQQSTDGNSSIPLPLRQRHDLHIGTDVSTARPPSPASAARQSILSPSSDMGQMSPNATDRVFPIRSVVSMDPTPTPTSARAHQDGYFPNGAPARVSDDRRQSLAASDSDNSQIKASRSSGERTIQQQPEPHVPTSRRGTNSRYDTRPRLPQQIFSDVVSSKSESESGGLMADRRSSPGRSSVKSTRSSLGEDSGALVTARFKHVVSEGGHAIITGRDGETLQRCEDEPIHIPGAVQGFGLLLALEEESDGKLIVRIVSENSKRLLGYTPKQLFALENFCDILSEEQADNLLDHVDFIKDDDADVATNGPEVFTISIRGPDRKSRKYWCAMHVNPANPGLVICEFELEDDPMNPLVPPNEKTPELPEDTLDSRPTAEELAESTQNISRPLRVLRSARKRKGEAAAMEVFNIMSQVQEQLAAAPNLEKFLKVLVGVVKELTGFHRVMIYQFDNTWNGRVVTELVDPRATKDLYKGLNFPASDIPKQARELYKVNKVRLLYDRDQETARLVCRTVEDLEHPLDLTYTYLRAMSPIHLKYLSNMAVRSSMSISINAFDELWGLIACHSYGGKGMRVSFPIRKMCRLVGDSASRNIERLSYASRLQARKLINTVPTQHNPSGYIIASSDDLLKLFDADFGLLSIRDETKILGELEQSQEALAMLEYLRIRRISSVTNSQDIAADFPDLRYPPGFQVIAGMLVVPLSVSGTDFIVFFRKGQLKEVKWAGNPYEKFVKEGTEGYLEPRKSFRTWSETVVGKCREWSEEEIETAAVLCLVYGKFIEVWRQKEAALQSSQLTRLLLANSAHEVRTPLNAIINYLEIALEGSLDQETRENLAKSHSASKSLIYVINDLLDLTKTEEGGELIKGESFDLKATFKEATAMFTNDAKRKGIYYDTVEHPGVPPKVLGDQRRVRQAISNITANAIQNTTQGGVKVEIYVSGWQDQRCNVEVAVADTGVGMSPKKLDALFRDLEQVQSETTEMLEESLAPNAKRVEGEPEDKRTLGLGLAVVSRIIRNMNGQLRLKSEEGKGSRFIVQLPFDLPDSELDSKKSLIDASSQGSVTPQGEIMGSEVTLVANNNEEATRPKSSSGAEMVRRDSSDSMKSKNSFRSVRSGSSSHSARSDVDRLIEAIQEPQMVERGGSGGSHPASRRTGARNTRPTLEKRSTHTGGSDSRAPMHQRDSSLEQETAITNVPEHKRSLSTTKPGQQGVAYSGTPVKALKVPDESGSPVGDDATSVKSGSIIGEVADNRPQIERTPTADHMSVLVAEDDPVNSKIVKKRLEKLGHEIYLTVNGEECASIYGEKPGHFDAVLMDMQMPIVDGLTSTKMIRSFEKSNPTHMLSARASLNGRIPIIAVSASLMERDRQIYIDAGFDGWILKPISFSRLSELMTGIVDADVRSKNLYESGEWERGGWFQGAQPDVFQAKTDPSDRIPTSDPSEELKIAAVSEDPDAGEEGSRQTEEQERLREAQAEENGDSSAESKPKSKSAPELGRRFDDEDEDDPSVEETVPPEPEEKNTDEPPATSPEPA
ncbi:phytochrome-like histidine kinase PHY1p [Saccharata proteae CBS 121410]|uniref:Phytochrome-like histidine kinase PHY1p n=1 Tax=Saccharata proteae CBS 121410 TaxID=1314787 RepID=A0A9P4HYK0_9PEZI|nr:phytochrome-like histidine kinase PHY1p [Saccharata proteae CBS 121410]